MQQNQLDVAFQIIELMCMNICLEPRNKKKIKQKGKEAGGKREKDQKGLCLGMARTLNL